MNVAEYRAAFKQEVLYLSGPITGMPDNNFPAFHAAEEFLRKRGYHRIINPADNGNDPDVPWEEYMKHDIRELTYCDAIYMLPGWKNSNGARVERALAAILGLEIWGAEE